MNYLVSIIFIILFSTACSTCNNSNKDSYTIPDSLVSKSNLISEAESRYENFQISYNSKKDFALCVEKRKKREIEGAFSFFVYDAREEGAIFSGFVNQGSVRWNSEYLIEVNEIPGMIKKDDEKTGGYLYDVLKRQKLPKQ